ncbi:hypothetical protein J2X98_004194 [Pseudarthrobacter enclensis]|uniref:Transposase n=1 Tax=Pseudarthrobacter enclensis TaxID=993070 RepID=A0ABT9RZ99_9MICC|nr:hypothetical protein [Pseudarthrobacter enclensis]
MSESTTEMTGVMIDPVTGEIIDQKELAERLLAQAKEQGVSLVGPGGLLNQLTRNVLETALEAELTEHLGHEHGPRLCALARVAPNALTPRSSRAIAWRSRMAP